MKKIITKLQKIFSRKSFKIIYFSLLSAVIFLVASYALYSLNYQQKFFPNIRLGKINLGGLSKSQARVMLEDKKNPQIDSITPIIQGAEWIEREMWELLGINFVGHPNLVHLLLMDDWPEGKFPLRHDHKHEHEDEDK